MKIVNKAYYTVVITYKSKYWPDYDDLLQDKFDYSDSSGMGMGERDHSYDFKTKAKATKFRERVKAFVKKNKLKTVKTKIWENDDY